MEITEKELDELLNEVKRVYGYDFTGYSQASLMRRVNRILAIKNFRNIYDLKKLILNNERQFESFLYEVTVNVTELFRDPSFFKSLRTNLVPALKTYPYVKIWDAGCSTGEEAYSLAILFKEESIYQKCKIYATDINNKVLLKAREGIFNLSEMKNYSSNYFKAGGKVSLSDYYKVFYEQVLFDDTLKKNIVFAPHNLVSDSSFNEFNLIVCRNVLIYFKRELQERVIQLFLDSLVTFGYLALGTKESLPPKFKEKFEIVDLKEKIYRKVSD